MKKILLLLFVGLLIGLAIYKYSDYLANKLPLINIYSSLEGATVYDGVGPYVRFVEIGKIKDGYFSFEHSYGRNSSFKLIKISEDGMYKYEAYIDASYTPKGSVNDFYPEAKRYATEKKMATLVDKRPISEENLLKKRRANFERVSKEAIYDKKNKLLWQDTRDNNAKYPTEDYGARQACAKLRLHGFSYWRLPTYKELLTVVDYSSKTNMIKLFKHVEDSSYWTSTGKQYKGARVIDMSDGSSFYSSGTNQYRCVKRIQRRGEIK